MQHQPNGEGQGQGAEEDLANQSDTEVGSATGADRRFPTHQLTTAWALSQNHAHIERQKSVEIPWRDYTAIQFV
jgi:hypothetical protein